MNLSEQVIEALQTSVKTHWTAIHFYTLLSNQLSRWGYNKLAQEFADDVKEESEHLGKLAQRLEFADVTPAVDLSASIAIPRHDIVAIFTAVLSLETDAATVERAGVIIAREASDEALLKVNDTIRKLFAYRHDILKALIADGVKPGETVVTDGQIRLVPGSRISVRGGGKEPGGRESGRKESNS